MNLVNMRTSALVLATVTTMFMAGCSEESLTNNDANISYINALNEQATFYVKESTDSGSVYDSKYKTVTLMPGDFSDEIKHKWFGLVMSNFAVEDTNTRDEQKSFNEMLRDNRDYWVIAWLKNNDYKLSLLRKSASDNEGVYRIRVFANEELDILLDGSNDELFTTEVGKVSDYFTVEKCTGLVVGNNEIDLCSGDLGRSYLVFVDASGLVALVEERY